MGSISSRKHEIIFENLEYGINIDLKMNGIVVTWDQYLSRNMKWDFGIFEPLKLRTFETLKRGNCGTKQPRDQETKKPRNQKPRKQETKKARNQETKKSNNFETFSITEIPLPPNIPTPTPAPAPLLGDTRGLGGHEWELHNAILLFSIQ